MSEDQKALYADPNNLPESHTYSVWRTENGVRTETIYNHKHMPKQIRTVNMSTGALLSEQQITYDSYLLPVSQTTTTGQVTSTETMQNDAYGNVVKQWSTRAGGAQNAEYLTQSTYDARFNQLTARTWKKDENTTVQEVYTLSEDGKHPVQKEVKVNGATAEKTGYLYDTYGNVTEERRYTSETQFLATHYSYTDTAGIARPEWMNFNGAYLTGVWQDGGTDIDGGAIGTIAEYYEYDLYGNRVKATDARNHTTQYEYDAHRRVTKITDAQNKTEQFVHTNQWIKSPLGEFTGTDHTLTYTDKKGTVTRYVYDAAANLRQVVDVSSGEVLQGYDYDKKYRIIKERNVQLATSGYETSYTYDCLNRVTQKETKNQANETIAKETAAYDDGTTGAYLKTTHTIVGDAAAPSVVSTQYVNAYGDVEKIGHITGGEEYFDTYTYNYVGEKVQEKSARAQQKNWTEAYTKKWEYDYAGRVLKEYNVDGDYISYQYNMLGQKVKFGDYRANASSAPYYTTYQYDAAGNLICETTPQTASQNRVSQYKYDKTGNRTLERILRDVGSQNQPIYDETAYEYDFAGHVTRAACGTSETLYTYDALGQCLTMSTGSTSEKHVTSYTYDRFGNNITVTSAGKTDRYEYDANGLRTKHIDKADVTHSYTPNALGQTRSIWTPKSGTRSFTYTLTGQVWEQSSGSYFMTNTYDDMGRIKRVTEPGLEKNYTYDVEGNRESFETKVLGAVGQSLNYTYDKRGNMTMVALAGASLPDHNRATYEYDENSNLTLEKTNAYTYFNYTYARDNTKTAMSGMNGLEQLSWSYSYYRNGNLKTETHNGNVRGYAYDEQNRLRSETDGVYETIYTYDAFGNRASKRVEYAAMFRSETQYTYDAANRLKHAVETTEDGTNTTYYQYDANGNLTLRAREIIAPSEAAGTTALLQNSPYIDTFQFNDYGEMTSAYVNGKQCSYSYRPDGLRINKTVNGVRTRHVLDGQNVSMDLNDDWSTKFSFIRGVRLVGYVSAQFPHYNTGYYFNVHGDVAGVVSGYCTLETDYTYDAFGNIKSQSDSSENPFQYCGEYTDAESGFIYLRARYYDPNAGRFISEDTYWNPENMVYGDEEDESDDVMPDIFAIRQSTNLYLYAMNNPLRFFDIFGLKAGDKYNSMDEAALAWTKENYATSLYLERELVSAIYLFWENGKPYYSYTDFAVGTKTGVTVADAYAKLPLDFDYVLVGAIHSHTMGKNFSNFDLAWSNTERLTLYLAEPAESGTTNVRKYGDTRKGWQNRVIKTGVKYNQLTAKQNEELKKRYKK